ncbi:DUF2652 domain-containing protein [Aridibaculum aurantiacum]|uniref:DUF2652 domain-containing protein n=1 Tax=Aridibaculum aurantiacum TaxID=2810307 RepID=UPI001A97B6CE|nr:DUF2652 domain-containing protein [Aridibaculum aurantiacum]
MKGIIFIPDITGFTNFVSSININTGMLITQTLLQEIMEHNTLKMEVSEIEGDAILFYKIGEPIPLAELFIAFKQMQAAFNYRYAAFKTKFNLQVKLSLKTIVHYGDIILYSIHGFNKLYGEAIIEAHRLLKTGNPAAGYILVTEDYTKALHLNVSDLLVPGDTASKYPSSLTVGITKIAYQVYPNMKSHIVLES